MLQKHIIGRQLLLLLDLLEAHPDIDELALHIGELLADLRMAQAQHAAHLLDRQPFVEHRPDLLEREAQALERQDAMQPGQRS